MDEVTLYVDEIKSSYGAQTPVKLNGGTDSILETQVEPYQTNVRGTASGLVLQPVVTLTTAQTGADAMKYMSGIVLIGSGHPSTVTLPPAYVIDEEWSFLNATQNKAIEFAIINDTGSALTIKTSSSVYADNVGSASSTLTSLVDGNTGFFIIYRSAQTSTNTPWTVAQFKTLA